MIEPYAVAVVQTTIRHARRGPNLERAIRENLFRSISLIEYAATRFGRPKLVVLPEFWLTGSDHDRSVAEWADVARRVPGPETEALSEVAQEYRLYVCGATMEYDPTWPGRWFNTAFIVGPNGDLVLKYRKINAGNLTGASNNTTPGDVYDEYVSRYGEESLWPVADTPLGRLGCLICYDVNFPENARMLAMRGAEIILHPTGEPHGAHRGAWESARRTRAYENLCYVVSANHGAYISPVVDERGEERYMDESGWLFQQRRRGEIAPMFRSAGGSEIVDWTGRVIARVDAPGEAVVVGTLQVERLRQARSQAGGTNFLANCRAQLYAREYAQAHCCPLNLFADRPIETRHDGPRAVRQVIDRRQAEGRMRGPDPAAAPIQPYTIACIQSRIRFITSPGDRDQAIRANLDRSLEVAEEAWLRSHARIVVMPEFWLQGFDYDRPLESWLGCCIRIPGEETDRLGEWAARHGVYVCGAAFESDPAWPGRFFNTAFILDGEGRLIHKYRKLNEGNLGGLLADTTPGDIYSAYVERYGADALFPVVDTPLGRLATLICYDVNFFEASRALSLRGAEVILHPTGEPYSAHRGGWEQARRTRAYENLVYWASANHGATAGGRQPRFRSRGHSEIVDFDGSVLAVADGPGEAFVAATVDIELLRRRRSQVGMNFPAQLRSDLYTASYERIRLAPNDLFLDQPIRNRADGPARLRSVVDDLQRCGVFALPDAAGPG